jgi:hypothetical protein
LENSLHRFFEAFCPGSASAKDNFARTPKCPARREILGDDFLERPRKSRIYYRGKLFAYPIRAMDALMKLDLPPGVDVEIKAFGSTHGGK